MRCMLTLLLSAAVSAQIQMLPSAPIVSSWLPRNAAPAEHKPHSAKHFVSDPQETFPHNPCCVLTPVLATNPLPAYAYFSPCTCQ